MLRGDWRIGRAERKQLMMGMGGEGRRGEAIVQGKRGSEADARRRGKGAE